jgi:excinuclease ABC subunit C
MLGSELEKIEGVGEGKRKALMLYFRSIDKIKNASVEELCRVKGISERIAKNIFDYFRKDA